MKRASVIIGSALFCIMAVTGCATHHGKMSPAQSPYAWEDNDLVKMGYDIADGLLEKQRISIDKDSTILVTSFVNIDNLKESSTLGRMLSEHVASRLSQRGYKVVEMRLRTTSVYMEEGKGEFLLSRDLREVSKNQKSSAVVVGTYGELLNGGGSVSARIVNPSDSTIISSCDRTFAKTTKTRSTSW